jgi:multisubunit Na+/H+ antiporter MnhG subunit
MLMRSVVLILALLLTAACASMRSAREVRIVPLTGQSPTLQASDVAACSDAAWNMVASTPICPGESSAGSLATAGAAIAGGVAAGAGAAIAAGSPLGWLLGHLTAPLGGHAILEALPSGSTEGSPDVTHMPGYIATYRRCLEERGYRVH